MSVHQRFQERRDAPQFGLGILRKQAPLDLEGQGHCLFQCLPSCFGDCELHDARVVQLAITETGWKALEQAMPLAFEVERRLLSKYSKAELRRITTLLEPLMH